MYALPYKRGTRVDKAGTFDNNTSSALLQASSIELWIPPLVGTFTERMPEAFDRSGGLNFYTRILFATEQPHNC